MPEAMPLLMPEKEPTAISEKVNAPSSKKSEEIQDIIERMPSRFGLAVTLVILGLVALLFLFGWIIKYPDTVTGKVTISAKYSPIELVANTSGKIDLEGYSPKDTVITGSYLAVLQNPANSGDVVEVKTRLAAFDINQTDFSDNIGSFPEALSMGELNDNYFAFVSALKQLGNYQRDNTTHQQQLRLAAYLDEQKQLLLQNQTFKQYRSHKQKLIAQAFERDSSLYRAGVLAEAEYERSRVNNINGKEAFQNILKEISLNIQQINETESQLQQLGLQGSLEERQMRMELISTYNNLLENIQLWEQKYVFVSPIDGRVEFLNFWRENQFVQAGEGVFSIVPFENGVKGYVQLPSTGAGKVEKGQKVIIKLDNYPYMQFGSVNGVVESVSLIANTSTAPQGMEVQNYLVTVSLPKKLTTNYGSTLPFQYDMKGTASIVSRDRRLIQRLFDNLKYMVDKK